MSNKTCLFDGCEKDQIQGQRGLCYSHGGLARYYDTYDGPQALWDDVELAALLRQPDKRFVKLDRILGPCKNNSKTHEEEIHNQTTEECRKCYNNRKQKEYRQRLMKNEAT